MPVLFWQNNRIYFPLLTNQPDTLSPRAVSVSQQEISLAQKGWSAKKDIIGKAVYNDNNEKIGDVK
jgi:hypothetical protein